MRKSKLTTLLLVLWTSALLAKDFYQIPNGESPNHLEPNILWADSISAGIQPEKNQYLAFYAATHSFSDDYSFTLYEKTELRDNPSHDENDIFSSSSIRESLGFFLTLKTTDDDEAKEIQISRELAIEIHRLWMKCLLQTTYAKKTYRGLDGTDYFFASGHIQFGYHGVIWSPRPNTMPRCMIEFADEFYDSAKKGKQFSPVEEQRIVAKIHALEEIINHKQSGDENSE